MPGPRPAARQLKDDDPCSRRSGTRWAGIERIFRIMALLLPQAGLHDAYVRLRSANPVIRADR
jgi:hypothetical protein